MDAAPQDTQPVTGPLVVLTVLATATLASFLGIGGGVVYVPVLVLLGGVDERRARGTSLGLIFGVVTVAFLSAWLGSGTAPGWWIAAVVIPFAIFMTRLATGWMRRLPLRLLSGIFTVVLVVVSLRLLSSVPEIAARLGLEGGPAGLMPYRPSPWAFVTLAVIGLAVGLVGPLAGIGGGLLLLPLLDLCFEGLDLTTIRATSLLIVLPTAAFGFRTALRHGVADAGLWRRLVGPAICGALFGSWLAHVLPQDALRAGFGLFLFCVALRKLYLLRRPTPAPD